MASLTFTLIVRKWHQFPRIRYINKAKNTLPISIILPPTESLVTNVGKMKENKFIFIDEPNTRIFTIFLIPFSDDI